MRRFARRRAWFRAPSLALSALLAGIGVAGARSAWAQVAAPAGARDRIEAALPEGLAIGFTNQLRWELWRFFDPAPPGGDPSYDFFADRARLDLRFERPRYALEAAVQYVKLFSLPVDAQGTPGGALGTGALYFGHSGERNPDALQLKYLSLELLDVGFPELDWKLGRFSYSGATETDSLVPKLEAVKRSRLADRLIGEFGWSHFQRSFDGALLRWDHGAGQATLAALRPTEGGFEDGGTRRIDDIDLAVATYTRRPARPVPGVEVQAFYLLYDDERAVRARVDNTGLPAPDRQDIQIHSFGGHAVGAWALGPGELDAMFWGVLQTGDWLGLDHRAFAAALELGYQLGELPWRPWLRVGTFRSSGDRSPGDGDHETFFQVLPTARLYSLTATYNLMNSTDSFVELRLAPGPRTALRVGLHDLRLSASDDRWYAGAGATQERGTIFGYAGRPSGGHEHLGTVLEASLEYRPTPYLTLHGFYGHLWGGSVVKSQFARDDDLDFFFLEVTVHFRLAGKRGAP